jgi:hypothetical protein
MAADNKRAIGIIVVGLANLAVSFIFLMAGKTALGVTFLGSGVVFFTIGLAAARKALPPDESPTSER